MKDKEIVVLIPLEQIKELEKGIPGFKRKKTHHMTIKKWIREFDKKYGVKEGQPISEDTEWLIDTIFKAAEEFKVDKNKKNV